MDETTRFWCERLAQEVYILDRVAHVDLSYPRSSDNPHTLQIGLEDVRAADDLRLSYDFDRDGWKIEQQEREELLLEGGAIFPVAREGAWREVAFVRSWALTTTHKEANVSVDEWLARRKEPDEHD